MSGFCMVVLYSSLALTLSAGAALSPADQVARWNRLATEATAAALPLNPLEESRVLAIVHCAIHDAVNSIDPKFERYRLQAPIAKSASVPAAIAAAAHAALVELVPSQRSAIDAALREDLDAIPAGDARTQGVELGHRAAEAVLVARKADGSTATVNSPAGTKPGEYRPTPPDFTPALWAHWGKVTPFVLDTPAQFRPVPPPAVNSPVALRDMEEERLIGAAEGSIRTDEQSEIARFWYESSPQGWNRITRNVAASQSLSTADQARLFALVNMAMADGYIAGFEAKYHYGYWRPSTAIRESGLSSWINYLPTPPVPDYPSNHTVLGAAVATVLERFFRTDCIAFSTTSGSPYAGITRRFWCFSEAARENGASRILAGIHFRTAVNAGYRQGEEVGTWVFENSLRPSAAATTANAGAAKSPSK